jgi:hypothetical protein
MDEVTDRDSKKGANATDVKLDQVMRRMLDYQDSKSPSAKVEFGGWMPTGMQERRIRRPKRKKMPRWAGSAEKIHKRIFGTAQRRYDIAYRYWCIGMNAREIAEEFKCSKDATLK